ncbi:S-DNA-T family DNA segregation ATPase FtsK/SpoIIIE [Breznakia sp. PF5-3]|uniref:DNA translocase FtsK n=1 Tax=unclassified Breznakia TaxID=2623764 RepID=UPI002406B417|nr:MULTISPECIES: DNA translocase FtsK [unclassified Breznakia]MDF9823934.1 S-DNA-T family DNA segregation ATPase FtsK/SpoIIIE [Breznakia sp. PM6-1]MDF9834733.1 S-DNA-T family DNA segregation ATPase FtsK/SpoIIIE [Breznakia sp. PF5-3]MDF9836832.1 S-DNA-T family DNA segregation ATPase FtsK/SpoIIIE [Breznakia sp. PFB2-8]MDF9858849.1 S-DNA-T family DNA segregation ATPase FtsK/SpoIIIE [Breznakia sp. PH5-24]
MAKKKVTKRKKNVKRKSQSKPLIENEVLLYIYNLIIITIALIGGLNVGLVGEFLNHCMRYVVGDLCPFVYIMIILASLYYMVKKSFSSLGKRYIFVGVLLFVICLTFLATTMETRATGMKVLNYYTRNTEFIFNGTFHAGGGIIGAFLYSLSSMLFDRSGTYIILVMLSLLSLLIVLDKEGRNKLGHLLLNIPKGIIHLFRKRDTKNIEDDTEPEFFQYEEPEVPVEDYADLLNNPTTSEPSNFLDVDDIIEKPKTEKKVAKVQPIITDAPYTENFSNYSLPKLTLLNAPKRSGKSGANASAANESGKRLIHILNQFGVEATLVATHIGPSVTKFELKPEMGVRVNRISNLQQDIKMGLAAKDIRIEAPIPGKSTVGIEIPNQEKTLVNIRDLMRQIPPGSEHKKLLFALGKDLMGNCVYGELNKMPHLLIAGATGSGKSVCVNSIITSILMRATPDEVKLLLIDPKKVEFTQYMNIPHLIGPVITDGEEASRALKVVVKMMEDRYELFSKAGVRNISGYNQYLDSHDEPLEKMPWIVVIIDELADLMLVAAKDVEASIQRITQLARAAGIHLVVATQRPSVDVITGVIKANIPSRIAFAVSSAIDSRTILDQQGAEKLLGLGDMLYIPQGENNPIRVQGCFVSDDEVKLIADYCAKQGKPHYEDTFVRLEAVDQQSGHSDSNDPLYEDVKLFVIESRKASTSFIQRKFSIGYSRAARLVDTLEANGIIGPANGSKPREVYVKNETMMEE